MMKRTGSVDATACSAAYPASDPAQALVVELIQGAATAWKFVLFMVDGALLPVAGAIGYRKTREPVGRKLAVVAIAGGLSILATIVSGGGGAPPRDGDLAGAAR